MRRVLTGAFLALLLAGFAGGQATQPAFTGPGLNIDDADPGAQAAVGLEKLDVRATLNGGLAQTVVTMTFRNKLGRQLEGDLEFPLADGAGVVGYALDVPAGSGNLVDGVCVEKERARQIFESEVRRGIDPGIVEKTRGNNYRMRVHPIPANGTRTVQLTYVSEVVRGVYTLPLTYAGAPASAKIRVEAVGLKAEDVKVVGLANLAFHEEGGMVVAEKAFGGVQLGGALTVTQAKAMQDVMTRVETRQPGVTVEGLMRGEGQRPPEMYFMVTGMPILPGDVLTVMPRRVGILWDTSLSRTNADRGAELAMVREMFKRLPEATFLLIDMEGKPLGAFGPKGDAEAAVKVLAAAPCDGALDLDTLRGRLSADARKDSTKPGIDAYVMFSDGLVTLGTPELGASEVPVYTACSDPKADHGLLKRLAERTGGIYLNLAASKADEAVNAMLAPAYVATLEVGDETKNVLQEVYPAGVVRISPGQPVTFTGRLHANLAKAVLRTGVRGQQMSKQEVVITNAGATSTGMLARFWAQQKAAELEADANRNSEALVSLGKEFNIVTARTSLMVLETVDQYLRYRIVPPKSRVEVYAEFAKRIEEEGRQQVGVEKEKIEHILALWKGRVAWWEKDFKPTKEDFAALKTKEQQNASSQPLAAAPTGAIGGAMREHGGPRPASVMTPPTESPRSAARQAMFGAVAEDSKALEAPDVAKSATITIKAWSPDTPYLKALAAAKAEGRYGVYIAQRKDHFTAPSYYLDCANFFLEKGERAIGVKVLTNIAQLKLEDAPMLRITAYRLLQVGEYDLAIDLFERAKALRDDEPQSWRDLAMALAARGRSYADRKNPAWAVRAEADFRRSLELYQHVVMNKWERFDEIEVIALMEANALLADLHRASFRNIENPFDQRLVKNLDCDVRIVMTWDADNTDIDLHVIEPTGEEAYYGYNLTLSGGMVSKDFTQGYGPEEYVVHHAPAGVYKIMANYYGSRQQTVQGPVTVQATVITNFGRPTEKRQALTLRLTDQKETVSIGEVKIGG